MKANAHLSWDELATISTIILGVLKERECLPQDTHDKCLNAIGLAKTDTINSLLCDIERKCKEQGVEVEFGPKS